MLKIALTTAAAALLSSTVESHYTTTTTTTTQAPHHEQALGKLIDLKDSSIDLLGASKSTFANAKGELKNSLLHAKNQALDNIDGGKVHALESLDALASVKDIPAHLDLGSLDLLKATPADLNGICYKDSHCASHHETEARCDKHHEYAMLGQCAYGHTSSLGLPDLTELKRQLAEKMHETLAANKIVDPSLLKEFLTADKKIEALSFPSLDLHARGIAMEGLKGVKIPEVPSINSLLESSHDMFGSFDIKKACFHDDHCDGLSLETSIKNAKKELHHSEYDHHCEKRWGEMSVGQCSYGETAVISLSDLLAKRDSLIKSLKSGADMKKLHSLWALSEKIDTEFPEFDLCGLSSKIETGGAGFLQQFTGAAAGHR